MRISYDAEIDALYIRLIEGKQECRNSCATESVSDPDYSCHQAREERPQFQGWRDQWDLVNVEAIPFEVMRRGIDWQWETHAEYLDALQKRGLGINVASLAALTPLRHYVMGEESFERAATAEEITRMQHHLREAINAGAFGFTSTILNTSPYAEPPSAGERGGKGAKAERRALR